MVIEALLLAISGATSGGTPDKDSRSIPPVHGTTFSGETVTLPEALRKRVGVLIVGFSEASRTEAADWGHRLASDPPGAPVIPYYEMPVLESVPRLLRGFVLKKIKESVSANGQAHFLPVLDHEAEWKRAAGFGKAEDAYVLVVDGNGVIRWRTEGALTEQAYAEVKRRASQIQPAE